MNFDFSIETSLEKIQNANTKEYFKEVYQTFVNGNYRSSTVMLYSVMICDLVYKLRDLRDIYGDTSASSIIDEIESMQLKNPSSPDWETVLIKKIKENTSMLEQSDKVAIESLQKYRHLSAHPVLNSSDLLYSPNREIVQFLIRNILEGILTNPPFFSNKIFNKILIDLAEVKDKFTNDHLEKYVKSKYLNGLKNTVFRKLFRSFWKVVFITNDQESIDNRSVNYKVLKIFVSHDKLTCIDCLKKEPKFYSNVNEDKHVSRVIGFLASFPEFYDLLEASLKLLIENIISTEDQYRFIAWFTKQSLKDHIISIDSSEFSEIPTSAFNFIKSLCENDGCKKELIDFSIQYFGASSSFAFSINRYDNIITQIEDELTLEQTKWLLEISNENDQIHNSFGMKRKLARIAEKYNEEIDKSLYLSIY